MLNKTCDGNRPATTNNVPTGRRKNKVIVNVSYQSRQKKDKTPTSALNEDLVREVRAKSSTPGGRSVLGAKQSSSDV